VESNGVVNEGDPMAALERNTTLTGFVESSTGPVGGRAGKVDAKNSSAEKPNQNPDAIDLGDEEMQEG
jgi:hypothetical protein